MNDAAPDLSRPPDRDASAGETLTPVEEHVFFHATIHPHRSLGPKGFRRLMACVAAASTAVGLAFFLSGAWPIVGFMGLDVLLLYLAFKASYRSAADYERVELTSSRLLVERVQAKRRLRWSFQPTWLRVSLEEPPSHHSQITLSSHGRHLVVGRALSPPERQDFANALRAALHRCRHPHLDNAVV
ncbi:DUF2244 domain-containing protein [Niveispirillum sp. SYP-B3756]|uniref:DUF2244 domain-containing protein n=1 Tax=Niveispirillum sp. SYP-B3756 TaxID=2662178 RepID=UPI001291F31E|nr:DUF2244 domain-containing protein [Niveispirillum sp. SYP-B3756]MQP66933.1 DUF2244 domain-containing protein [Niveispirillum sp. SYP-B3756]